MQGSTMKTTLLYNNTTMGTSNLSCVLKFTLNSRPVGVTKYIKGTFLLDLIFFNLYLLRGGDS